jgi:hypothetical protein
MTEEKKAFAGKIGIAIAMAVITGILTGAGTSIYRHELSILSNARHIERLKIKDYRQHKDSLRGRVTFLSNAVDTLEAVMEIEPMIFGPNSSLVLKARKSQLVHAEERLENYVEENKHGGRDD